MKTTTYIIALFFITLTLQSCKSSKSVQEKSAILTTSYEQEDVSEVKATDTLQCRFLVDFYSIGAGINSVMYDQYMAYIEQQYDRSIYSLIRWGMEGEIKVCFHEDAFTSPEIDQLILTTKEMMKDGKHVRYKENVREVLNGRGNRLIRNK